MSTELGPSKAGQRHPARDLAGVLRQKITGGEWERGRKLPTARELAAEYSVALTTAVRAVETLRGEGLVVTTRGQGSYVTAQEEIVRGDARRDAQQSSEGLSPNRAEAETHGFWDEVDLADRWTEAAPPAIADRLGISANDPISGVRYRFRVAGTPTQIAVQWEPLELTRGTTAELPASNTRGAPATWRRFADIGWRHCNTSEEYRARVATPDEAELLELPEGVPVLEIRRTRVAEHEETKESRVIEAAVIVVRSDRMVIRSIADVPAGSA